MTCQSGGIGIHGGLKYRCFMRLWVRVPFSAPQYAGMMELVDKMDLKSVDYLVITGSNPVTRTNHK